MGKTLKTTYVALIGNYVPRRCGIATFTEHICESIAAGFPKIKCIVGAVNDRPEGYDYPNRVRFEMQQNERDSYRRAAEFLNINNVEVLSLQHEFGIYGGPAGRYILTLLKKVKMPVVTTLHTVLEKPNQSQLSVMKELDTLSSRFIVMAQRGKRLLESVYAIPSRKIDVIPHGVIDIPFVDTGFYKDEFGVEGKTVMLTFGLLSPNKGIENVIKALPAILKDHPDVVYIVLGATHPHLVASQGEKYRRSLEELAKSLGVERQVIFYDRFVSIEELREFISAADIYITPYLNEAQVTSGTLAFAFGAGKAVISTPYWHAQELLANGRGQLVPFADSEAIAAAAHDLLAHPKRMTAMRKRAWKQGREMTWPVVAMRYMEAFEKARATKSRKYTTATSQAIPSSSPRPLPEMNLSHLFTMSDHTGIFQHAIYNVPNFYEGYCTDDTARALILTVLLEGLGQKTEEVKRLADTYAAFLWYAFDRNTKRFRNFMNFSRQWLELYGSEDSHARALWAVATVIGRSKNLGHRSFCTSLFQEGLPLVGQFRSPRAWAFSLLAIHEYLRTFSGDRMVARMRETLTTMLVDLYRANEGSDWKWFEQSVTYDNAKLPHALILSGYWTSRSDVLKIGLESLRWLLESQTSADGHFSPVGCHGFWNRGGEKAQFDQQPLEAYAMISACLEAFCVTREDFWKTAARRCFDWFLGWNDLGQPLHDPTTGGCRDALLQDRVNENQGAESSLAFYLSLAELLLAHPYCEENKIS